MKEDEEEDAQKLKSAELNNKSKTYWFTKVESKEKSFTIANQIFLIHSWELRRSAYYYLATFIFFTFILVNVSLK